LAIYMGGASTSEIAAALIAAGRPAGTPVRIVEAAGRPDARPLFCGRLDELGEAAVPAAEGPVLVVVGEAAGRGRRLAVTPIDPGASVSEQQQRVVGRPAAVRTLHAR